MTTKAKVAIVVVLFLAALSAIGALTYKNRATMSDSGLVQEIEQASHPVRVQKIHPESLVERLVSTGVLKAEQDVLLTAEVAGKVKKVFKQLGDPCKKGEILLRLDAEGYQIGLAQAQAAVKQGMVALDHAERDYKRMQALKESAVVTAQQLDAAEGAKSSAAASVEQAEAALRMAARNLRETSVRCPFAGFVAERMVDSGQTVGPQTPLARLVDTSRLKLALSVTSAEISRLKTGQSVMLADPALPGRTYRGEVSRVGVAADAMTRNFPIEVLVDEKEMGLRAGQIVHATLDLAEHRDVLAVPLDAITTTGEGQSVFVVEKNQARKTDVTTGPRIEGKVIITGGLKPGAEVITVGGSSLEDGATIEILGRPSVPAAAQSTPQPVAASSAEAQ